MSKKFISILAILVMAVCLVSGGCTTLENQDLKTWQELLKITPEENSEATTDISVDLENDKEKSEEVAAPDQISIDLYFIGPDGQKLALETRTITKKEGLARSTIEELINGPQTPENLSVFPEGTRLLDINIKPDGKCIVDFSSQLTKVNNEHQEKMIVYALVNTLGQFPSVQEVEILINGNKVDTVAGFVDVSAPLEPDYTL